MSKSKSHRKDKKKSSQLVLRIEKAERDAFVVLCELRDTTAAREIRRFMRDWVATHSEEATVAAAPVEDAPAMESAAESAPETLTKATPDVPDVPKKRKSRGAA
jgi:maleate cis-trans isomerase